MEKNAHQRLAANRRFGWSFGAGMVILSAIGFWKHFIFPIPWITVALASFSLVFAFIAPNALLPLRKIMEGILHVLGLILTWAVFGAFYYIIFTPIVLILRLAGKDVIAHKSTSPAWSDIPERDNDPERVKRMY